jgi:hypothetical protein
MTETIAQFIRSGDAMYVQCGSCDHYERLDMEMLRKRLGDDQGAFYPDLKDKLKCSFCGSKEFSFVRQAKGNKKRNSYAASSRGS